MTWAAGDFGRIGSLVVLPPELLCEALDIHPDEKVLDVGAGNGAASLAAARRWADVTALDFVEHLLESARKAAAVQNLRLRTKVGDAQALPFKDGSFDVVLSTYGAMFAPDQQRTADELVRVCRSGGRIGMTNWTPDSLVDGIFKTVAAHVPRPAGLRSASEWGTRRRLEELFGDRISALQILDREFVFRFPSDEYMLEYYRAWYGPTLEAFDALDREGQARLSADLLDLYRRHNRATDGTLVATSHYAEVVAVVA
ncbi:class I SAM-dependent methyltransferase [Kribbella albertanoniae]|uniref:class I SAM-dependent methyltransferase n=1 Tax=Kribbella albertanoniae TaxID=1266829 RepID=UPI00192DD69D|nr:class I SAM-dependent methyltransferase [Kribbella albertanoniae]